MPADPKARYGRSTGPRDRTMRVGDAEREAVGEILRREHVNGRLDAVEFQERLDRSLAAKTYSDLDTLVADLPDDAPPRPRRARGWTPRPWPLALFVVLVLATIVASHGHVLWLALPIFAYLVLRTLYWRSGPCRYRGYGRS
jgi:DUF1707 SHOCT-like domain